MFKFDDEDEKKAKGGVLQDIIDQMDQRDGEKLKKPVVAEMSVAKITPEGEEEGEGLGDEEPGMGADALEQEELSEDPTSPEDGPSEHDKAMIASLYERFCK